MVMHADIENISREEKLRAMEALWQEISKEDPAPESPAWHADAKPGLMSNGREGPRARRCRGIGGLGRLQAIAKYLNP